MSETVRVVKFRGGMADGLYRVRLGDLPGTVRFTRDGETEMCAYAGEEPQLKQTRTKTNERVTLVEAVYHIYRPVEA